MPHEIIMPALGMAQDSGVIVQWLKAPGDAVAEGDALFEVETDKATMEVEAQAAGFLTDLRAKAGDDVPVGQVIAVISDKPETDGTPASAPAPVAAPASTLPEGAKVIMPALGMAQDTGLIVSWAKAPGDAVAEDDTLLEVETDKSTMEVPAGASGFVAALLAEAGQEVPVGEVIAVISAQKPDQPMQARAAGKSGANSAPAPAQPEPMAAPSKAAPAPPAPKPAVPDTGRIFASPKARRLAAEAGLDLSRLVAAGYPQPYHAADIETLRSLPAEAAPEAAPAAAPQQITARADSAPGRALLDWLKHEAGRDLPASALWSRFAAAALRSAAQAEGDLVIELAPIAASPTRLHNPDRAGLASDPETTDDTPDLILRDLSTSAITGLSLGAAAAPTLSLLTEGEGLRITLAFTAGQLEPGTAIALVAGFADRLNDPLAQLL